MYLGEKNRHRRDSPEIIHKFFKNMRLLEEDFILTTFDETQDLIEESSPRLHSEVSQSTGVSSGFVTEEKLKKIINGLASDFEIENYKKCYFRFFDEYSDLGSVQADLKWGLDNVMRFFQIGEERISIMYPETNQNIFIEYYEGSCEKPDHDYFILAQGGEWEEILNRAIEESTQE